MTENTGNNKFWKVLSTRKGFTGEWIDMNVDDVELPDGKVIKFEAVHYHNNGVGIAAENDKGEIILVKSYRYINDFTGWEIPAGTIDKGMHHSDVILKELKEEAGCEINKEDLKYLGFHYASIGSSTQEFHCYHGKNVRQVTLELDANEIQDARWFTKEEIKQMILNTEIKDGFSLSVLQRVLLEER